MATNPAFFHRLTDNLDAEDGPTNTQAVLDVEGTGHALWVSARHPVTNEDLGEIMIELRGGALFAHVHARPEIGNDPTQTIALAVLTPDTHDYARERIDPQRLPALCLPQQE